jgi:PLP dependent protein
MKSSIAENLTDVRQRIAEAARRVGRDPAEITLVAVSKRHPIEAIREAWEAGQRDFGENYAQELRDKAADLCLPDLRWHYIGHLQKNKIRHVAPTAYCVHTIDSAALAHGLSKRISADGPTLPVLIQVDVAGEKQKSGVPAEELSDLLDNLKPIDNLHIRGLMTMPPFWPAEQVRPFFRELRNLRDKMAAKHPGLDLKDLSMGMTSDFEAAIEEGSTIVRVGTAIFGPRE